MAKAAKKRKGVAIFLIVLYVIIVIAFALGIAAICNGGTLHPKLKIEDVYDLILDDVLYIIKDEQATTADVRSHGNFDDEGNWTYRYDENVGKLCWEGIEVTGFKVYRLKNIKKPHTYDYYLVEFEPYGYIVGRLSYGLSKARGVLSKSPYEIYDVPENERYAMQSNAFIPNPYELGTKVNGTMVRLPNASLGKPCESKEEIQKIITYNYALLTWIDYNLESGDEKIEGRSNNKANFILAKLDKAPDLEEIRDKLYEMKKILFRMK